MEKKLDCIKHIKDLLRQRIPDEVDEVSKTYYLPKSVSLVAKYDGCFSGNRLIVYTTERKHNIMECIVIEGTNMNKERVNVLIGNLVDSCGLRYIIEALGSSTHNMPHYVCVVNLIENGISNKPKIMAITPHVNLAVNKVKKYTDMILDREELSYEMLMADKEKGYTMTKQREDITEVYYGSTLLFKVWFDIQQVDSGEQISIIDIPVRDKFGDKIDILAREIYNPVTEEKEYVITEETRSKYLGSTHKFLEKVHCIMPEKAFYQLNDNELQTYLTCI